MQENRNLILVVGSTNMDMAIRTDHFPRPGETLMGHDFMRNFGGKGANQAVAAARLGGNVAFVGKVGSDDWGNEMLKKLKAEGIDTTHVYVAQNESSGLALITTVDSGENSIIVSSGANACLTAGDVRNAAKLFGKARVVLMQLETPVEALVEVAQLAKQNGACVVLNPAPAPKEKLPAELLTNVDFLIPNETEATSISGVSPSDEASVEHCAETIMSMGVPHVLITMGEKGVLLCEKESRQLVPACKANAVDTTAAGDTFCGAFCKALTDGKEIVQAAEFANKASAISVSRRGAQISMPYLREIETV